MPADTAKTIRQPLFTSSNHPIEIIVYDDNSYTDRHNLTGKTVKLLLKDAGGTMRTNTVSSHDDAVNGETHVTLTGANHITAGDADAQVLLDDVPKAEFTIEFRTLLA